MQNNNVLTPQCPNSVQIPVISPPYKVLPQLSLPNHRIFAKSQSNTPMMLCMQSNTYTRTYRFLAGESYRKFSKNVQPFPLISPFELLENPQEETNIFQCRICLDNEDPSLMISPCLCNGFQKYVHEDCLKTWLLKSDKDENELTACEVCKGKFEMTFSYAKKCYLCADNGYKFWLPFAIWVLLIVLMVLLSLSQEIGKHLSRTSSACLYSVLGVIDVLCFFICLWHVQKLCDVRDVTTWNILNSSAPS